MKKSFHESIVGQYLKNLIENRIVSGKKMDALKIRKLILQGTQAAKIKSHETFQTVRHNPSFSFDCDKAGVVSKRMVLTELDVVLIGI